MDISGRKASQQEENSAKHTKDSFAASEASDGGIAELKRGRTVTR